MNPIIQDILSSAIGTCLAISIIALIMEITYKYHNIFDIIYTRASNIYAIIKYNFLKNQMIYIGALFEGFILSCVCIKWYCEDYNSNICEKFLTRTK